ncbi:MAG: hypothetical protein AMJ93_08570 [Anaerolineae bacterium SM23_84]|nr:MAG: hypothetical protein AMJ93_08570 [Anaerolineae bacterium SM23_84]
MQTGRAAIRLPRGLHIEVHCVWLDWRMDLWREDTYPSEHEVQTVRRAFDVPDDAVQYRAVDRFVIEWSEDVGECSVDDDLLTQQLVLSGEQMCLL